MTDQEGIPQEVHEEAAVVHPPDELHRRQS